MDVFLDPTSRLTVTAVPNIDSGIYEELEKMAVEFAFDTFMEMKDKRIQKNQESYNKYMYALQLRTEAAEHIGIENIRVSRLRKLEKEKASIQEAYKAGSQIYPDFKLAILIRLEA